MYLTTVIAATAYAVVGIAAYAVSNRVEYQERIQVNAPAGEVFDHCLQQSKLMQWSAWPKATGSECEVEGEDGIVGAKLVFLKDGVRTGHQRISEILPGKSVTLQLADSGPIPHTASVQLEVSDAEELTEVTLNFENTFRRPFHLLAKAFGMVEWVRDLHRQDLQGLRRYSESQASTRGPKKSDP